ncbi:MAG: indolepyruvate ferredoxin oxidoreductase subunit alpha [Clostridia bacterium]
MTGNEAIARGAYEAGVTVATAYPGTPSTEILENIGKHYNEISAEWSPNEKVALEVGIGSAIVGARTLVTMKHVGVNVAADPLMSFTYTGVNGGLVLVSADDPGMHSSQNEQDNRVFGKFAKIPILEPADSGEAKSFLIQAFDISEKFDTPVLFRMTTRTSHAQSLVELAERNEVGLRPYVKNTMKNVLLPAHARLRHPIVEERVLKLAEYNETSNLNKIEMQDKKMGIITSGAVYQYVKEVLPEASVLKLGMTYPLPKKLITEFITSVDTCYVIEELEPFIEDQIKAWGLKIIGKEVFPLLGEFSPEIIAKAFGKDYHALTQTEKLPVRPPVLCPGCPHRSVFYAIGKLKLRVSGDIGCYTLAAAPPLNGMDTCICMGASISAAHGMEKARGREFAAGTVAVIGDSTFMHSGITGLMDIVYNGGTSTVLILDNDITAMTGQQENPATGITLKKQLTRKVDLELLCHALGIERVQSVDAYDVSAVEKAIKEEVGAAEPSVVIIRRPCVLLKGKGPTGMVHVNKDKCKSCGMCAKVGCPAIVFKGSKMPIINETLCNGCLVCAQVCPFGALEEVK